MPTKINNQAFAVAPLFDRHKNGWSTFAALERLQETQHLTIGLASHDSGFFYGVETAPEKNGEIPFVFTDISGISQEEMRERLHKVLSLSVANKVDILLFPELTVDKESLEIIQLWLKENNRDAKTIKLVVAGSFHFFEEGNGWVNRSVLLDSCGNIHGEHNKITPFNFNSKNLREDFKKGFGEGAGALCVENISTDNPLVFYDTPIGRMATLICRDILNPTVTDIFTRVQCDYIWCPSMTASMPQIFNKAKEEFGFRLQVLTAVCAAKSILELSKGEREKEKNLSFLYAPSKAFMDLTAENNKASIAFPSEGLLIYKIHELI